jgi:hypothetical protein
LNSNYDHDIKIKQNTSLQFGQRYVLSSVWLVAGKDVLKYRYFLVLDINARLSRIDGF